MEPCFGKDSRSQLDSSWDLFTFGRIELGGEFDGDEFPVLSAALHFAIEVRRRTKRYISRIRRRSNEGRSINRVNLQFPQRQRSSRQGLTFAVYREPHPSHKFSGHLQMPSAGGVVEGVC